MSSTVTFEDTITLNGHRRKNMNNEEVPLIKPEEAGTKGESRAGGLKWDKDKLMWDLLPLEPIEEVVDILSYGANKYKKNSWRELPDGVERYYAAALRHIVAWRKGEQVDPESGKNHLAHALCNLIFISYLDGRKS